MKDDTRTGSNDGTVLRLDGRKRRERISERSRGSVKIAVETACRADEGPVVRAGVISHLERLGHSVTVVSEADWVLSIIAFRHGSVMELSIVLRMMFRSTLPGTETVTSDGDDPMTLREGGWRYESLRFHGLFGIPETDLDRFFAKFLQDLSEKHWTHCHTSTHVIRME